MHESIVINGMITLHPNELHTNISEIIEQKIRNKYIVCNKEYGCVNNIIKIHKNYTTEVERNSGLIKLYIKFLVQRILPTVGKKLKCIVHMIFNHGIFAQIEQNIKILIPTSELHNATFISHDKEYGGSVFATPSGKIKVNDTIEIIITDVKYSKNRYNCIGNLH